MFFEDSNRAIYDYISEGFIEYNPEVMYCTIYQDFLAGEVATALERRNEILLAKQKAREKKLQEIYLDQIEKNLNHSDIRAELDNIGILDKAIQIIIESSALPDIKKVLSYPIVKEEIRTTLLKRNFMDKNINGDVISAIVSILFDITTHKKLLYKLN